KLATIFSSTFQFVSLKHLDVSCNKLKHLNFISTCTTITTLLVYDNELEHLNDIEGLCNLSTLHAQYNYIREVDKCFTNLTNLTDLRLDANKIIQIAEDAFVKCTHLTNLDLSYNLLESIEFIAYIPNLAYLSLSHNHIRSIDPLAKCSKLLDADVSDNLLVDHSLNCEGYRVIQRLNLSNNSITKLSDAEPARNLISLNLCNNKLTKLPNLHLTFPKLETLELWGNQLEDTEHLLDNLAKCENLREISFDENISKPDAGDSDNFNDQLITQIPQLVRVNGKEIRKTDALKSSGVAQTHARQRQIYDLIERQLSSLAQVTSPMIASVNKSYDIIQELLTKVDEDMQQRSELALVEAQNPTRSSIKTKLKEALDFASSATNKNS
ncbi:hypothetical protein P879_10601, partial [Paragonimus westermani]